MTDKKLYVIVIYGKDGCTLCTRLKAEVNELLARQACEQFDLHYQNLSTQEGMVAYAKAETVNGQRLPALQILKYDPARQAYRKIRDLRPECPQTGWVPTYLQLQTDYQREQPAIQPQEVEELMDLAQGTAT